VTETSKKQFLTPTALPGTVRFNCTRGPKIRKCFASSSRWTLFCSIVVVYPDRFQMNILVLLSVRVSQTVCGNLKAWGSSTLTDASKTQSPDTPGTSYSTRIPIDETQKRQNEAGHSPHCTAWFETVVRHTCWHVRWGWPRCPLPCRGRLQPGLPGHPADGARDPGRTAGGHPAARRGCCRPGRPGADLLPRCAPCVCHRPSQQGSSRLRG